MPLKVSKVESRPTGLYLALLSAGSSSAPSSVTGIVSALGAAKGANTVPVAATSADIPKNAVLTATVAGGSPATMLVVVTADTAAGAATIPVEMYEGVDGAGLDQAMASTDTLGWDGLYTVVGTENSAFANNPSETDLTAAVYGSTSSRTVSTPAVTSIAPAIVRNGLFDAQGQLTKDLLQFADSSRNWYVKQVIPDSDGNEYATRKGVCRITGFTHDLPADGLMRASFNIKFMAEPTMTFPS